MKRQLIYMVCATALLSSCNLYKNYERPADIKVTGLYRDTTAIGDTLAADTSNFGNVPWRQVFTDPQLQALIEQGLSQNTDLLTAALKVREAEASLKSAKLAFAPSVALSATGTVANFNGYTAKTYSVPLAASWDVDLFGKLLNTKKGAQMTVQQMVFYKQAVQTSIVSAIANYYYTLLMLDQQLDISTQTAGIMKENAETMQAMKDAAMTNEAAVSQSKEAYAQVLATLPAIRQSIRETENALCALLHQSPQKIGRSTLDAQILPTNFSAGVPVQLLANRPDVKASESALAASFYNVNVARASFYPQLNITGSLGWTNSAGGALVNPGKILSSLVGSITQPLFSKGRLTAQLEVAKAQQEEAKLKFEQTLLNAGNEVSNALSLYQTTLEKSAARTMQVDAAEKSAEYTKELFHLGSSTTYLEVLSAQQSLLSARLAQISDRFDSMQAVVSLYSALGGGRE